MFDCHGVDHHLSIVDVVSSVDADRSRSSDCIMSASASCASVQLHLIDGESDLSRLACHSNRLKFFGKDRCATVWTDAVTLSIAVSTSTASNTRVVSPVGAASHPLPSRMSPIRWSSSSISADAGFYYFPPGLLQFNIRWASIIDRSSAPARSDRCSKTCL